MAKKTNMAKVPKGYAASSQKRRRLLEKLYPEDTRKGELELVEARDVFMAKDGAIVSSDAPRDLPLRNNVFIENFVEGIMMGMSISAVCEFLEVPKAMYEFWMLAAAKQESPYVEFARRVVSAQAYYERTLIEDLKAAKGNEWQKFKFLLEVHAPERWSPTAMKKRAELEYSDMAVSQEDSNKKGDTINITQYNIMMPDNGREEDPDVIDITPDDLYPES